MTNPDYNMSWPSDVLALSRMAEEEASQLANMMTIEELKTANPIEIGHEYFDDRITYDNLFVDDETIGRRVWVDAFETAFRRTRRWREPPKTTLEGWV